MRFVFSLCAMAFVLAVGGGLPAPIAAAQTEIGSLSVGAAAYYKKDYVNALRQWRQLTRSGNAAAEFNIGVLYLKGLGVKQNYTLARRWFMRSAKQNFTLAQHNLGWLYQNGLSVKRDLNQAREWYRRAAAKRFAPSETQLGNLLYQQKNYKAAKNYLLRAARRKQGHAQFLLGEIHARGLDVKKDLSRALKWYRISADNDDPDGTYALARYYIDQGDMDNPNVPRLLNLAAEHGNVNAVHDLGWLFAKGYRGVSDEAIARKLFLIAATLDHWPSSVNLAALYSKEGDYQKTYMWFLIAERLGAKAISGQKEVFSKILTATERADAKRDAESWLANRKSK